MEHRRKETAPALLIALGAMSLSLSCAIAIGLNWPERNVRRASTNPPRRASNPIVWQVTQLPPLTATPPLAVQAEPVLSQLLDDSVNQYVTAPYKMRPFPAGEPRLVVWLPQAPRWKAGHRAPYRITSRMRRDWSLGPLDSLALAKASGRLWQAASMTGTERFRAAAGAAVSSLRNGSPSTTSPRLIAANRPVTPIAPLLIVEYLAKSHRGGYFPAPSALAGQLDRVATTPEHAAWAWAAAYRLRTLMGAKTDEADAHRALDALTQASAEAYGLADEAANDAQATELRRAAYALSRRTATWRAEQSQALALRIKPVTPTDRLTAARWAMAMPLGSVRPGMLLSPSRDTQTLRLARRLEAYEQKPSSRLAMLLAEDAARLANVDNAEGQALASAINGNYRNANLRVAIAADLIERMLPKPEPIVSVIRDRIAGAPVTGRSTTETVIAVLLTPDDAALRIGLQANGVVTSRTQSRGGPAVLNSKGSTSFAAKKLVVVTPDGLRAAPTVADAQTMSQRLVGLSTNYDRVPLLGNYVRSAARSEYGRLRTRAKAETRTKVERQISQGFDQRVNGQLGQMEDRFTQNVIDRATSLGLTIEPIEMRTTGERLISRLRIAGEDQLGSHTPRMRAPSDSLLSFQMHESTLNNALEGLGLAGQKLTSDELRQRLVRRLGLPAPQTAAGEQATFRFAGEDPVRLTFKEGRVELTLQLDEIAVRGRRHRNFRVHAFYKPVVEGLTAMLVQDGTPHIEGRLRTGARIHLHGVMGKVLGENARLPLVQLKADTPERFAAALRGLETNQFVIEDGWLGVAIGPPRSPGTVAIRVGTYVR